MFNIDMALRNEATAKAQRGRQVGENTGEAGFHFIALVPIGDHVWKLDGLERQPQRLGGRSRRLLSFMQLTLITQAKSGNRIGWILQRP